MTASDTTTSTPARRVLAAIDELRRALAKECLDMDALQGVTLNQRLYDHLRDQLAQESRYPFAVAQADALRLCGVAIEKGGGSGRDGGLELSHYLNPVKS